ncbi:MAG TPA: ATP-dependent metallopeptidase FtsH/Yme1/Tma family protein [Candidatus Polarisedimenticolia bacterium]|nr:ATP-dependent metallopeptidase FtsH/Yme1/Tma family protein [Candidatus Polarisedimenticolia bacterium]
MEPRKRPPLAGRILFWLLIVGAVVLIVRWFLPTEPPAIVIDQQQLLDDVRAGKVASVSLPREAMLEGRYAPTASGPGQRFFVPAPQYQDLVKELDQRGVSVGVNPGKPIGFPARVPWLGIVLLVIAILVRLRQQRLLREALARL